MEKVSHIRIPFPARDQSKVSLGFIVLAFEQRAKTFSLYNYKFGFVDFSAVVGSRDELLHDYAAAEDVSCA